MCRIACLFLLQRLKGSVSGDASDFNNIETRAVNKFFFFLEGKAPKESHAILTETLTDSCGTLTKLVLLCTCFSYYFNLPYLELLHCY